MISLECMQAIREKNILRLRLMLKNSLLLDTSFNSFREIERAAIENGIDIWEHNSDYEFQRKPQPWTIDDVNYEITAIVDDFTRDHMDYLMEMIRTVCGNDYIQRNIDDLYEKNNSDFVPSADYQAEIIALLSKMNNTIKNNRKDDTRKLSSRDVENINWNKTFISEVRRQAERIAKCCEELERRE